MIFGRLFRKKKQDTAQDKSIDAPDAGAVATALPQQYDGDAPPLVAPSSRKTKMDKNNTALGVRKKRRSHRVVHTRRSFHRAERRPVGDQVNIYDSISRPVITEKAANQSERGVYTFLVSHRANKHSVADAIEVLYGVRPKKVRIAQRPPKRKRVRIPGREQELGFTTQKKKAYVFLREGDTIKLT